jgi:phenylacetate-coenzyme A ligase PaaK-like adenylate-forming protein
MSFDHLLHAPQYSFPQPQKEALLVPEFNALMRHHRQNCPPYNRLIEAIYPGFAEAQSMAEIPFLPVALFKTHRLSSVPESDVFKTLTSSGTSGQQVSQVPLDRQTALRQTTALSRIMMHVLGPERLPMILVESASVLKDRRRFNARAAGVLGMMNFGRRHFYALDDEMNLDEAGLRGFLEQFGGEPFLIFGFTYMVWQYFFLRVADLGLDLSQAILVHSGGWKKLEERAVGNTEFRRQFADRVRLTRIYNFYGMAEQVGSVFVEGEDGYLYPPNFADVIVRDPSTFREQPIGEPGVIQVLSLLPSSYPGHSLLTEDLGVVRGVDDSKCGRAGKYFSVLGRVPKAELRGCSDVHASQVAR